MNRVRESLIVLKRCLQCTIGTIRGGPRADFSKEEIKDKAIIVMGNGPSAKTLDYSVLAKNADFACVNYLAADEELFFLIKPVYYFMMDPEEDFGKADKQPNQMQKRVIEAFGKVDWEMRLVLRQGMKFPTNNPNISVEYVSNSILDWNIESGLIPKMYKKNLAVPGMQNTVVVAIYYCIAVKRKNIYVIGLDFDYLKDYRVDENNHVKFNEHHFYGVEERDLTKEGLYDLGGFYHSLAWMAKMLYEFGLDQKYADYEGSNIINLNEASFVDAFKKGKFIEE